MNWASAGMLQGLGQGMSAAGAEAVKYATTSSLEQQRQAMEDKRAERTSAAAMERQKSGEKSALDLQKSRLDFEGGAAQRLHDTQTNPENVAAQIKAEQQKKTGELQGYLSDAGLRKQIESAAFKTKMEQFNTTSSAESKAAVDRAKSLLDLTRQEEITKATDPVWINAHKALKEMDKTQKERLEEVRLTFMNEHQAEDRLTAIRKADDATAIAIMHSGDTELGRLHEVLAKRMLDFMSAETPNGKLGIESVQRDIAREKAWVKAARDGIASRNGMKLAEPLPAFVAPSAKTVTVPTHTGMLTRGPGYVSPNAIPGLEGQGTNQ